MTVLPVIANPAARGGRGKPPTERLERLAHLHGIRIEWWWTTAPGHATELAARAARDGAATVAVWGGDGTYNEAAAGLVGADTALLILPGGTTSVLTYELGIPRNPGKALVAQIEGERRAMVVGRTNHGRIFLLMLSAGPDSLILSRVPAKLKSRAGQAGIGVQAVIEFVRGKLPRFEVDTNGIQTPASWCIVGNGRRYGGPFAATPGADPFTAGLEVVTLTKAGRRSAVGFFFGIPSGRHVHRSDVTRQSAMEVVFTADQPVPYQLDGDHAGVLPVVARATDERVWVLVPR